LKIQFPAKPPERPREESCILTEGQSVGPIKVLQVDVKSGSVRLNDAGTDIVVTFTKNGPAVTNPPPQPVPTGPRLPRRFTRGGGSP
jgi:hypothetical protein